MKKVKTFISLVIVLCFSYLLVSPLFASDILVSNYSFESGMSGWTQAYGSGGITTTTEQKYTGSYSLKINDTSSSSSLGLESNQLTASPGQIFTVSAKVYIASGEADLYVRFWDISSKLISSVYIAKTTPLNQWSDITVKGTAPSKTSYVSILLYTGTSNVGTVYYDNINITTQLTNIGTQVTATTVGGTAIGKDESNNDVAYTVVAGTSSINAQLCVINLNTSAVTRQINLPGAEGAWAVTIATDGKVYAGSYSNGHLYQYTPGSSSVVDLGQAVAGENFIWDLKPGLNGKVYGGTSSNCYVFKYEPGIGFTIFGPNGSGNRFDTSESYVRSISYDSSNSMLYTGLGATAKLTRFDCNSGQTDQILPSVYQNCQFVNALDFISGKVFCKTVPGSKMPVMTVTEDANHVVSTSIDCEIPDVNSMGVSQPYNNTVYYTTRGFLYYYNILSKSYGSVLTPSGGNVNVGFDPELGSAMKVLQLSDQTNYPGYSFVSLGSINGVGKVFKYNFNTGNTSCTSVNGLLATPVVIQSINAGPDGRIYSGGYVAGGIGTYSPVRSDLNTQYKGISQSEGMVASGSKMYFGVYSGALIYEYDPSLPWSLDSGGNNPNLIFSLTSYDQDRPFGMATGGGYLFVGTVPAYGKLGGVLAVYNTAIGGNPVVVRNIVQDQSVVSLAYKDGIVYGGTSIWGGLGSTPTQTEAKFFAYRVSDGTKLFEITPVSGKTAVTGLTVGPDGNIWGMDEGYLFIYSPSAGSITYSNQIYTGINYSSGGGVWKDAFLVTGNDGNVYGVTSGKLFKVDASTKNVTTILSSGAYNLAKDSAGYLYYTYDSDLYRYVP